MTKGPTPTDTTRPATKAVRQLDARQIQDDPHWKEDFDVDWDATDYISRREFTRYLSLSSAGLALGTTGLAAYGSLPKTEPDHPRVELGRVDSYGLNTSTAFEYPEKGKYALLTRHDDGSFSAYSQKCPHLGCAVYYDSHEKILDCPCHEGFFDARTGDVISGPPQRGLNLVELEIVDGVVYAVGGGGH